MMAKPMVSVIVTTYNKERFIMKCLESIDSQNFESLEIVIIDDGSTDATVEKCRKFVTNSTHHCVLRVRENGGVANARNEGIACANGKFITFVDGDDYIIPDYISLLYRNSKYDLVQSGFIESFENKKLEFLPVSKKIYSFKALEHNIINQKMYPYFAVVWGKLFNADIINENNILFVSQSYGEDSIFVFDYLKHINSLVTLSDVGYVNVLSSGTLSRKKVKNMWEQLSNVVNSGNKTFNYEFNQSWVFMYMRSIKLSLLNADESFTQLKRVIKEMVHDSFFNKIKYRKIQKKSDKLLITLLRIRAWRIVYILVKLRDVK